MSTKRRAFRRRVNSVRGRFGAFYVMLECGHEIHHFGKLRPTIGATRPCEQCAQALYGEALKPENVQQGEAVRTVTEERRRIIWYAGCNSIARMGPFESAIEAWAALRIQEPLSRLFGVHRIHVEGAYVWPEEAPENE